MNRFTLEPRTWYAFEFTFPNGERHYSPIFCFGVEPKKSGAGWIDLNFWHLAYAEGVNHKVYELRVLHRDQGYLLATRPFGDSHAGVLITALTGAWLQQHFPEVLRHKPSDLTLPAWMNQEFPGAIDHTPAIK